MFRKEKEKKRAETGRKGFSQVLKKVMDLSVNSEQLVRFITLKHTHTHPYTHYFNKA